MNRLLELCNIRESDYSRRTYPKGRIVDDNEGHRKCAVLLLSGRIDAFAISPDGREVLLSSLSEGCLFGISNLFTDNELRTVLQCRMESTLLFIPKSELRKRILSSEEAMKEYSMICNSKIQFLLSRIEQLSANTSRSKLIEYLISDHDEDVPLTRTELASRLGISRAALFREIAYLQEAGAITVKDGAITVTDESKLLSEQL